MSWEQFIYFALVAVLCWAAVTWLAYLVYIHYRLARPTRQKLSLWMLIVSFCLQQMCWWGINYLPSAKGSSVHTYSTK